MIYAHSNPGAVWQNRNMTRIDEEIQARMREWRHHLHKHPETAFEVDETAAYIAAQLETLGLEVHRGIGKTGLVAVLEKGDTTRKSIALRADMDAMPINERNTFEYRSIHDDKMHACGHDGHTAMMLGAASQLVKDGRFAGTVYLVFQPNEENGLGAQAMIDDGLFERFPASECYSLHNVPGMQEGLIATKSGPIMASENLFDIEIVGKGGHASAPEACIDPVTITGKIIPEIHALGDRDKSIVVSITEILTDGARNVIPSNITIKGECRTFHEVHTESIEAQVRSIAKRHAQEARADCSVKFSREFIVAVNSESETRAAGSAALQVKGEDGVDLDCEPMNFSEDFAHMLNAVPGCYVFIGNGADSVGGCALHNPYYDFNDEILTTGASYWVALVEQQLGV